MALKLQKRKTQGEVVRKAWAKAHALAKERGISIAEARNILKQERKAGLQPAGTTVTTFTEYCSEPSKLATNSNGTCSVKLLTELAVLLAEHSPHDVQQALDVLSLLKS